MKNDKMLNTLTPEEADGLEQSFASEAFDVDQERFAHQRQMILDKIAAESAGVSVKQKKRGFKKYRLLLLAAAMILLIGSVVTAAVQQDWDLRFAEQVGIGNAMESLSGGFVKIDQSSQQDDIKVTINQSIGDQNSQWIQIDTDVDWDVSKGGYYLFSDSSVTVSDKKGMPKTGGYTLYGYENNGNVSFWIFLQDYHKINRSTMDITVTKLCKYEPNGGKEVCTELSQASWSFHWQNQYAANVKVKHPVQVVTAQMTDGTQVNALVTKVEITPVSIRIVGVKNPKKRGDENRYATTNLSIDGVILKDGTTIQLSTDVGGEKNGMKLSAYASLEGGEALDLSKVASIIVCGKTIDIE